MVSKRDMIRRTREETFDLPLMGENPVDVRDRLDTIISEIEQDDLDRVYVQIETEIGVALTTVVWKREETDDEYDERIAALEAHENRIKEQAKNKIARDKADLRRLAKQYPDVLAKIKK